MPAKNPEEYTHMRVHKKFLRKIDRIKVHPNQSYEEAIFNRLKQNGDFVSPGYNNHIHVYIVNSRYSSLSLISSNH